jgi:16S rRNA G966 N2-methylase RsmD
MSTPPAEGQGHKYDRAFLLSDGKRNQVVELWEVQQFGIDSFADPEYVCIYGMPPTEWHRRGIRLLARTTLAAVRDKLGDLIGQDVARLLHNLPPATTCTVIDPFAGSCNGLYWLVRHVRNAQGLGFEIEQTIFDMTTRNLHLTSLERPIALIHGDYKALLATHRCPADQFIVAFLAPPWGDALSETTGLDLGRTKPPITEIVDDFERVYTDNRILYVIQVHQHLEPGSLAKLKQRFEWSDLRIYDINVEGMKHGVLIGTKRWTP